jgi:hypothetical protein
MEFLPPGVGFAPSDELLVSYYLANKNNEEVQNFNGSDLIKELNLYQYDPLELPLSPSFFFRHPREFYCFTAKVDEQRRHCKIGFWMRKGVVRDICGVDNVVVGKKSLFMFYIGNSPQNAIKTSWTMYEYTQVNNPQVCHLGKLSFHMFIISSMINLCIGNDKLFLNINNYAGSFCCLPRF